MPGRAYPSRTSAGVAGRFASATFQYFLDLFTVEDGHRQGYLSLMAETAIVVGDRKELTYLLSQAAELEHGLLCEYLYAAFSLKSTAGPGLRADQLESVGRWREIILRIAAQEMMHWAMGELILGAGINTIEVRCLANNSVYVGGLGDSSLTGFKAS